MCHTNVVNVLPQNLKGAYHKLGEEAEDKFELLIYHAQLGTYPNLSLHLRKRKRFQMNQRLTHIGYVGANSLLQFCAQFMGLGY